MYILYLNIFFWNLFYPIWHYIEKNFCEKRNSSTLLGIEPRTFHLPVECSIVWATEVPHNFSHRIYLRLFGYGYIMNQSLIFLNHFSSIPSGVEEFLFSHKFCLHSFTIRFVIFLKKCQLLISQKPDVLRKNRGQIWNQHRKRLWKWYISFHKHMGHILLTSVIWSFISRDTGT